MKMLTLLMMVLLAACASPPDRPQPPPPLPDVGSSQPPAPEPAPDLPLGPPLAQSCQEIAWRWQACEVAPVGDVLRYVQRTGSQYRSYWLGDCCVNGKAQGSGLATWCRLDDQMQPCSGERALGRAIGKAEQGRLYGSVEILRPDDQSFRGRVDSGGGYRLGKAAHPAGERFIGDFYADGEYKSGSLYRNGKVHISQRFENNNPVGTVLVGGANGQYAIWECAPGYACQLKHQGLADEIRDLVNAAADVSIDKATAIGKQILAGRFKALGDLLKRKNFDYAFNVILKYLINRLLPR